MSITERVERFIRTPIMDKVIAAFAASPFAFALWQIYVHALQGTATVYEYAIAANIILIICLMLTRRLARRVTMNPLFWVVTFARSYWLFLVTHFAYEVAPVPGVIQMLSIVFFALAIVVIIAARLNLGRNVGYLPARRDLVTSGLYAYVRHPIHTGDLLFCVSYILHSPTPHNIALMSMGIVFVVWKSIIEERFLRDDEDYREYCRHVPYRWIPGVI